MHAIKCWSWAKSSDSVNEDFGRRLKMVSTEEIVIGKPRVHWYFSVI